MKSITFQLPTILGSFSAMLVAFLSLMNGTSPSTCLIKAASAFVVFSGLGLILRYALADAMLDDSTASDSALPAKEWGGTSARSGVNSLDVIVPGTSVADLLGEDTEDNHAGESGYDDELQQEAA